MTEALAYLLATFATCADPSLWSAPGPTAITPLQSAAVRAAWDPETHTWGAAPKGSAAATERVMSLGGPELPFETPIGFALPNGGRGWYLGKSGMERVRVVRGPDGRFHQICEPAQDAAEPPAAATPAAQPTDR